MIIETIQKLKKADLFYTLKSAMEIVIKQTRKPQSEWDILELNCNGLKYNHAEYMVIHKRWIANEYASKNDYFKDLDSISLKNASENSETFKSFYSDDDCKMSGLDFGCIKWNLYFILKGVKYFEGDYDFIKELTDISFSCLVEKLHKKY